MKSLLFLFLVLLGVILITIRDLISPSREDREDQKAKVVPFKSKSLAKDKDTLISPFFSPQPIREVDSASLEIGDSIFYDHFYRRHS